MLACSLCINITSPTHQTKFGLWFKLIYNHSMKKLFLLLILSLFSTQSFAGSCPDGSEPVKSVSDDGTYFVYNCGGGGNEQSSSSSATKSNVGPVKINIHDEYQTNNFSGLVDLQLAHGIRTSMFGYPIIPLIDVNDDGHKDLIFQSTPPWMGPGVEVTQNSANMVVSLYNTERKEHDIFDTVVSPNTTFGNSHAMNIADLNGDGRIDMVSAVHSIGDPTYTYGGVVIFINTGKGIFVPKQISKANFTHSHNIGDLDGDGDIDIIYHTLGDKNITCAYNDGKGNFANKSCLRTPKDTRYGHTQNIWGFRIADFDNDGFTDVLLLANHGSQRTALEGGQKRNNQLKNPGVFWGNGSGKFSWNDMTFIDLSEWNDKAFDRGDVYFTSAGASKTSVDIGMDGDVDFALNIESKWTLGSAVVLVENLGNRQFKTKEITRSKHLKEDPKRFRTIQDKHTNNRNLETWHYEGIVWNQSCLPKFIDLNNDNIEDMICEGTSFVDTNEVIKDRWDNHSPIHNQITPYANPSDWTWEWGMGNTYYILDEESNVVDEGNIFNKSRSDFSDEFKRGGYNIKTLGYRFQNDSTSEEQAATEITAKELMDEILEELEAEQLEENKSSLLFDGRYSFTISRYNENEGSQRLGNGYIEINNGIITVAKEGRTLDTGSIDLYDSFEGQINNKGNIISSMKISVLFGVDSTPSVDLNGSIESPLQGEWDHYFDVILKLGEKE